MSQIINMTQKIEIWAEIEHARTSAYATYEKHCGPRAVECADGDLLGELLNACKTSLANHETRCAMAGPYEPALRSSPHAKQLRDAIAKATGDPPPPC